MERKADSGIELRYDAGRVIEPPQVAARHQMTTATWCHGLYGTGSFQTGHPDREPELPVARTTLYARRVDADDEASGVLRPDSGTSTTR